jgi:hypothetical protein
MVMVPFEYDCTCDAAGQRNVRRIADSPVEPEDAPEAAAASARGTTDPGGLVRGRQMRRHLTATTANTGA